MGLEVDLRRHAIVFALLLVGTWAKPPAASARPVRGDKTLRLYFSGFSYGRSKPKLCDSNGDHCVEIGKYTYWTLQADPSCGYLLSDLIELGIGLQVGHQSSSGSSGATESETSTTSLFGDAYGKLHLGSDPRIVPFLEAGGGLGFQRSKATMVSQQQKSGSASLDLFMAGGIDYYLAEKYALTGSVTLSGNLGAFDSNTDDKNNSITESSSWSVGIGLGVATYF